MMRDNDNYTNYGLRSNVSPTQNSALTSFENDIVRNIEFRNVCNHFQDKLEEDINEILSSKNLSQQTCTKCKTQITTNFEVTSSPVIIENAKTMLSIKSTKKLKK